MNELQQCLYSPLQSLVVDSNSKADLTGVLSRLYPTTETPTNTYTSNKLLMDHWLTIRLSHLLTLHPARPSQNHRGHYVL